MRHSSIHDDSQADVRAQVFAAKKGSRTAPQRDHEARTARTMNQSRRRSGKCRAAQNARRVRKPTG